MVAHPMEIVGGRREGDCGERTTNKNDWCYSCRVVGGADVKRMGGVTFGGIIDSAAARMSVRCATNSTFGFTVLIRHDTAARRRGGA